MYYILFPSGAHGNFLKLLLNSLSDISVIRVPYQTVYDNIKFDSEILFEELHHVNDKNKPTIEICVRPESYLKYFAMVINRVSGINLYVDDLGTNVFKKLEHHTILKFFVESLTEISGQTEGNVDPKYIREWYRICFFADNGNTISQFSSSTRSDADYIVDFESFYDGSILDVCYKIYNHLGLSVKRTEVAKGFVERFPEKVFYYNIDKPINTILNAIDNDKNIELSNTNLLQQAWIDNYLVSKYNISPLLRDNYFQNTQELKKIYNIT